MGVNRTPVSALIFLWILSAFQAFAADAPSSEALLPPGWVLSDTYRQGPGTPVGKVASVTGKVVIVHADGPQGYLAEVNHALYEKDLLVTREQARATIELNDGSRIALAEVTRLIIDRSVYDPSVGSRESFLEMSLGKARFWVRKIIGAKRSAFRVKTETAIAGVRGSDFVIQATRLATIVTALKNTRLEVFAPGAPEQVVVLADFQRTVVAAGKVPGAPEAVSPQEIDRLMHQFPQGGGSKVSAGSTIVNTLSGKGVTNVAVGEGSEANLGTVNLKGASVKGSVVNQAAAENAANVAVGRNAAANLGAVKVQDSKFGGTIVNQSESRDVVNSASGPGGEANVGSVVVE